MTLRSRRSSPATAAPALVRCLTRARCVVFAAPSLPSQKRGGMAEEAYGGFLQRSIDATHPLGQVPPTTVEGDARTRTRT